MHHRHRRLFRPGSLLAICSLAAVGVAGTSGSPPAYAAPARGHGPVDVLYAGSLVGLMSQGIGPAFDAKTGYTFNGFSGGSDGLASEIKGKTQEADVFVSASPAVNATLKGQANGNWVSWYATFATSPLVIGYNPTSPFAAALRSTPWYEVATRPGFILGRTTPATDPKGQLAEQAVHALASTHNGPDLLPLVSGTTGVYPEQALVGLLQAGQVDAGFFYASEAKAAGIPTVPVGGPALAGTYTMTVVNRAPHQAGGKAFVRFLLSPLGRSILSHDGLTLVRPPRITGAAHVPRSIAAALRAR